MAPGHYSSIEIEEIGRRAWKTASRAAKHMSKHSKIVNPSMEKCIPRFERDEVILGEVLGSGGFNDVFEVKRINLVEDLSFAEHAKKISSPLQAEHRSFVAKHVFRESSQNCRYAIKFLSVETIEDASRFCTGAADLVVVRSHALCILLHSACSHLIFAVLAFVLCVSAACFLRFHRKQSFSLPFPIPTLSNCAVWPPRARPAFRA
jgi:hypothetical protein